MQQQSPFYRAPPQAQPKVGEHKYMAGRKDQAYDKKGNQNNNNNSFGTRGKDLFISIREGTFFQHVKEKSLDKQTTRHIQRKYPPCIGKSFPKESKVKFETSREINFFPECLEKHNTRPDHTENREIPFSKTSKQKVHPKQIFYDPTMKNQVKIERNKMLEKGAIKKVQPRPDQFLSNIFLRPKKDGTFRPVINLKELKTYIPYQKFRMETLKDLKDILWEGDFMLKIDLKDAYFSIPLL